MALLPDRTTVHATNHRQFVEVYLPVTEIVFREFAASIYPFGVVDSGWLVDTRPDLGRDWPLRVVAYQNRKTRIFIRWEYLRRLAALWVAYSKIYGHQAQDYREAA
jgi:hypothetical protein